MAIEMAHCYTEEHSKQEVTLPEEFKRHTALFLDKEANTFPPGRGEGDHKIELLETAPASFNCKVYPLSKAEQEAEDKFLDENLAKGYIVPSNLPYGFSTFMVPKKGLKGEEIYHQLLPPQHRYQKGRHSTPQSCTVVKVQGALRCAVHGLSGDTESHKGVAPLVTMGGAVRGSSTRRMSWEKGRMTRESLKGS